MVYHTALKRGFEPEKHKIKMQPFSQNKNP